MLFSKNHFRSGAMGMIGLALTGASLGTPMPSHAQDPPGFTPNPINHTLPDEPLGLFQHSDFELTTGNCNDCGVLQPALWYFQHEVIALPKSTQTPHAPTPLPFLIWLGSPEVLQHVHLDESASHIILHNGAKIPLKLTSQIPLNRSFYNHSTAQYFQNQPLRLRGYFEKSEESPIFVVKMIWPEHFRLELDRSRTDSSAASPSLADLIEDQAGGATAPFLTQLLWERHPESSREWANHTVLGFILNGAQGDDDEAQGGHFGLVTGQVGPEGQMASWMMNNFYDLDVESEKGIIPGMLPLDHYLMDLNSGQSYYRPSYLIVAILRQDRIAKSVQASANTLFEEFYRHDFLYHHAKANCTGLSIDILRHLGWAIPSKGPTSYLKATGAFYYVAATEQSLAAGEKIYDCLTAEQTRLFPRMAFETAGQDLLRILAGTAKSAERTLTQFERDLKDDVEAVVFVRIPQIPSSRASGTYPVLTFNDYEKRVPKDRKDWQVVPISPRPIPETLRERSLGNAQSSFFTPTRMLVVLPITIACFFILFTLVRLLR
jgi:hypothetical protein